MTSEPSESGAAGASTPVLVEDLFLTDSFLIKGRLAGKYQRLSKMLENPERSFLPIEDAIMISLRGNDVVRTPKVLVNVREVVFAHELVEIAGDDGQKSLAADEKNVRVRAFYNGSVQLELAGRIAPGAYESASGPGRQFFVMRDPVVRGLNLDGASELRLLENLDYAIIQKDKLSYIYDFS